MRFLSAVALALGLLLVSITEPVAAQADRVSFFCQADGPGSPRVHYYESNGELRAAMPDGARPSFGRLEKTATTYSAFLNKPLMTNGTGTARIRWALDRTTGIYTMNMHFHNPAKPKPLIMDSTGRCDGFSPPDGQSSDNEVSTASSDTLLDRTRVEAHARATRERADEEQDRTEELEDQREQEQANRQAEQERAEAERAKREEQDRVQAQRAEQERLRKEEEARIAREKADADRKQKEEADRLARERAAQEAKRKAEADRVAAENGLRSSFNGWATTCPGGGKDVLYLQTSRPSRTGCNVRFEARCPSQPSGSGVSFGQANYIGGSCMGLGDIIRIGQMSCHAKQVQISMTSASCGN